jgi:YD repeat-containing protein
LPPLFREYHPVRVDATKETYTYDGAGRLATVTRDGIRTDSRYYDAAGRVLVSGMMTQDITSDQGLLTFGDRGAFDTAVKTAGITSQFQIFAYDPGAGHADRHGRRVRRGRWPCAKSPLSSRSSPSPAAPIWR